jgi:LAGLIDADG endonuclease
MKTMISNNKHKLHPLNVTGYYDGEGCFNISVYPNVKMKTGYSVTFSVEIKQHSNSINLLYSLKEIFNDKGSIKFTNKKKTVSRFKISNIKDILTLVIPHFNNYPLVTSKHLNYLDFKLFYLLILKNI